MGKYTAENGPSKACNHFTKALGKSVLESAARKQRDEYLTQVKTEVRTKGTTSYTVLHRSKFCQQRDREGHYFMVKNYMNLFKVISEKLERLVE